MNTASAESFHAATFQENISGGRQFILCLVTAGATLTLFAFSHIRRVSYILLCCLCKSIWKGANEAVGRRASRVIIVCMSSVRRRPQRRASKRASARGEMDKCVMRPEQEHWSTYAPPGSVIFLVFRSTFAKNTNEDTGISSNRFGQIPRHRWEFHAMQLCAVLFYFSKLLK